MRRREMARLVLAAAVLVAPSAVFGAEPAASQPAAAAAASPAFAQSLYDRVRPSLVGVKYTWETELGPQEITVAGIVISADGLVLLPIGAVSPQLVPDEQMKDFRVIVPNPTGDEEELDATFQGRDERSDVAFVKVNDKRTWKPVAFEDVEPGIGERVYSVGLLPKGAGHKAFLTEGVIAASLRGPVPQVVVSGALGSIGSPVFSADGKAIGYVHLQPGQRLLLDDPQNEQDLSMIYVPPKLFVPTRDFAQSLSDPPTPDHPVPHPWLGCPQMKGLDKEVADFFHLAGVPAVQIGDVLPDSPAEKAGLKRSDIITQYNGKPLERGDLPEELPAILARQLNRLKPGDTVTFSVIHDPGSKPHDVTATLGERPKMPWQAKRFYAADLGFAVRESVFVDTYARKLPQNTPGVVIALIKPNGAAQTAHLNREDFVTQMNGKPVTDLEQFKADYQAARKDKPHDPVVLVVARRGGTETINIEPPQDDGSGTAPTRPTPPIPGGPGPASP